MSTTVTTPAPAGQIIKIHSAKPSFFGILRGEFFKIRHQWITWIMLVLLLGAMVLPYIVESTAPNIKTQLLTAPLHFFYNQMSIGLSVLRVFTGIFLLIVTATAIGLEYQLGTIRVLLARGVGRLQLLSAKLLAVAIIALLLLVFGILLNGLLTLALVSGLSGNLNALNSLTSTFWSDTWTYILTILLNMGVTILLATAVTVLFRSLSFGLSASLVWFPIDNIGIIFLVLAFRITHQDFWQNISAYFLGPNLNIMASALTSGRAESIGAQPLVQVDGTHTVVVALVYAVIFAVVAIILTWKRDVKE